MPTENEPKNGRKEAVLQSREEMARQRDQIANILDSMVDGVYISDQQYNLQFVNRALETQFGAVEGRKCYQYLSDREEVCPWCRNSAVFNEGKIVRWEWHSEKTGRTYDLMDVPLKNADGSVSKLEVFRDITERKQMEQALKDSEQDLSHAQAVAHTGSWRLDVRHNRLLWSDETHRIFAIPKGTPMTYETFLSCVHPDDREYVDRKWQAALRGEPYDIEHRIVVDDEIRWVRERAELEFDSQKLLQGGFGTVQDVTERKWSEEQYQTMIRTAMDGFWLTDAQGKILDVNDSYCKLIGYSREELLTMSVADVEAAELPEETARHIERVKEKGYDRFETRHRDKNGRVIDVEVSVNFTAKEGGRFFVFVRDITERKKAEQLKDEFIGLVSHELRTPLTVINGSLSTLLTEWDRLSTSEVRQLLNDALLESESLSHLIENLLELSRAQAQQLALYLEPVDIRTLVRETVSKIKRQATAHRFTISIPDGLQSINADPLRVERILYNLLDNAAKYSPAGTQIKVSVSAEPDCVVIGVNDRGKGLSSSEQARIFGLFRRLENSRPDRSRGAGLGLMVCRRLVEAHGGKIWIESKKGSGSTFFFSLPVEEAQPRLRLSLRQQNDAHRS